MAYVVEGDLLQCLGSLLHLDVERLQHTEHAPHVVLPKVEPAHRDSTAHNTLLTYSLTHSITHCTPHWKVL